MRRKKGSRWCDVSAEEVAEAIFKVVGGNGILLSEYATGESTVWSKIAV
jgi:hypothetical protein